MIRSLVRMLLQEKTAEPVPAKVEERLSEVERTLHTLQLEWAETQDKVHRWMHRTIKRAPDEAPTVSPAPAPALGPDPISARLLARRGGVRRAGAAGVVGPEEPEQA